MRCCRATRGEPAALPGERLLRIGDGGQRFVIHFDEIDGIAGDVAVGGDHDGDRMTDEVGAIDGENVVVRTRRPGSDAPQGTGPTSLVSAPV
jgi:hypothetical protein